MTKKVIAIISVLKPIDDTRNYEKVAGSIGNTNKYDINIIGFSTKNIPTHSGITFFPIFSFKRNSFKRPIASAKIFKLLIKLKPELIVVTTAELLIVSILYRIIFGVKLVYDIQENYCRNIIYTNAYPSILKYLLASIVRAIEFVSLMFIDKIILAEKIYKTQMRFLPSNVEIIENKAIIPAEIDSLKVPTNEKLTFIYTGTIAEHYGVFDAIDFIKSLRLVNDKVNLVIIGHAAQNSALKKVADLIQNNSYIKLVGGDSLISHNQILMEMKIADFCLLPYQKNRSTDGRFPTKLFECLAMEKPVLITSNPIWNNTIIFNNAGLIIDFKSADNCISQITNKPFYGNSMNHQYKWNDCSKKIEKIFRDLI